MTNFEVPLFKNCSLNVDEVNCKMFGKHLSTNIAKNSDICFGNFQALKLQTASKPKTKFSLKSHVWLRKAITQKIITQCL